MNVSSVIKPGSPLRKAVRLCRRGPGSEQKTGLNEASANLQKRDTNHYMTYRVSSLRTGSHQLPQLLRSSLGAPAGGVLVLLSMQGMALRYSYMAWISWSVMF